MNMDKAARLRTAALASIVAVAALASCARGPTTAERTDFVIGTVCSIRILDGGSEAALDESFARLREIEERMSANAEGTAVDTINRGAGGPPVAVPSDVLDVVARALRFAGLSGGAFDPTIGPIVKLWSIGMEGERIPSDAEIAAALGLVGYRDVLVDREAGTVRLARAGMRIDLGAIAKGYAADEVARILEARGVKAAVVDLGGNVKVVGRKPDGSPWRIGIQDPFGDRGSYIGIAELDAGSTVVTSGVYERYFTGSDGTRYHHILDTATGRPVSNGLVSVTIITGASIDADGLSTTLFALGLDRGLALAASLPGVEAVFVDEGRRVYGTPGSKTVFKLLDDSFTEAR